MTASSRPWMVQLHGSGRAASAVTGSNSWCGERQLERRDAPGEHGFVLFGSGAFR